MKRRMEVGERGIWRGIDERNEAINAHIWLECVLSREECWFYSDNEDKFNDLCKTHFSCCILSFTLFLMFALYLYRFNNSYSTHTIIVLSLTSFAFLTLEFFYCLLLSTSSIIKLINPFFQYICCRFQSSSTGFCFFPNPSFSSLFQFSICPPQPTYSSLRLTFQSRCDLSWVFRIFSLTLYLLSNWRQWMGGEPPATTWLSSSVATKRRHLFEVLS